MSLVKNYQPSAFNSTKWHMIVHLKNDINRFGGLCYMVGRLLQVLAQVAQGILWRDLETNLFSNTVNHLLSN